MTAASEPPSELFFRGTNDEDTVIAASEAERISLIGKAQGVDVAANTDAAAVDVIQDDAENEVEEVVISSEQLQTSQKSQSVVAASTANNKSQRNNLRYGDQSSALEDLTLVNFELSKDVSQATISVI